MTQWAVGPGGVISHSQCRAESKGRGGHEGECRGGEGRGWGHLLGVLGDIKLAWCREVERALGDQVADLEGVPKKSFILNCLKKNRHGRDIYNKLPNINTSHTSQRT